MSVHTLLRSLCFAPLAFADKKDMPEDVQGVDYDPHLIGLQYSTGDTYDEMYSMIHSRDLKMISEDLGANVLRLSSVWDYRTWGRSQHKDFAKAVKDNELQLIPTFDAHYHFKNMVDQEDDEPDPTMRDDLNDWASSLEAAFSANGLDATDSVIAWTINLSPSVAEVMPTSGSNSDFCKNSVSEKTYFQPMLVILKSLRDMANHIPLLKGIHFLLPLDMDTASVPEDLYTLLSCGSRPAADEVWGFSKLFDHWLLSSSLPTISDDPDDDDEEASGDNNGPNATKIAEVLANPCDRQKVLGGDGTAFWCEGSVVTTTKAPKLSASDEKPKKKAYWLTGASSVRKNELVGPSIVEDVREGKEHLQQQLLIKAKTAFERAQETVDGKKTLGGFLVDEWADNWDRGSHGPFHLADDKEKKRDCGGRYAHDGQSFNNLCLKDMAVETGEVKAAPEFLGLVAQYTIGPFHCMRPRFAGGFGFNKDVPDAKNLGEKRMCVVMLPRWCWLYTAVAALLVALVASCRLTQIRSHNKVPADLDSVEVGPEGHDSNESSATVALESNVVTELGASNRCSVTLNMSGAAHATVMLKTHLLAQKSRLDHQIVAEILALQAQTKGSAPISLRKQQTLGWAGHDSRQEAMENVHARVLEGFACWAARNDRDMASLVNENTGKPLGELYAQALLLRLMESLAEHIISCPERLACLFAEVLREVQQGSQGAVYTIDLARLHDGLDKMQEESNPYKGGLNFDDINDCGMRNDENIRKTFKEPSNYFVIIEIILNYRVALALKCYIFLLSMYLYLGSGKGGPETTVERNGDFFHPQWHRTNLLIQAAWVDAGVWALVQLSLFLHRSRQRGCPRAFGHLISCGISCMAGFVVYSMTKRSDKPEDPQVLVPSSTDFKEADPRCPASLGCGCVIPVMYLLARVVLFVVTHHGKRVMLIQGTPQKAGSSRRCTEKLSMVLTWVAIIASCVWFEMIVLQETNKLSWQEHCGFSVMKGYMYQKGAENGGVIEQPLTGPCLGESKNVLHADCASCVASIVTLWMLVILMAICLDMYFIFFIFSGLRGFLMGHARGLDNLKNPMRTIDLCDGEDGAEIPNVPGASLRGQPPNPREVSMDVQLAYRVFGQHWKDIWTRIVESLYDEDLISERHCRELYATAGLVRPQPDETVENAAPIGSYGSHVSPMRCEVGKFDLMRLETEARDRLTMFFGSLVGLLSEIDSARDTASKDEGEDFNEAEFYERHAISTCHVGHVPSLSQVIPVYNETILPTVEYLIQGDKIPHAQNQENKKCAVKTLAPLGDGQNTNLGFIISQHQEEWKYLAERLDRGSPMVLYNNFTQMKGITDEEVMAVRLWAAMRMQSVAKTVVGAMHYQRFLRELPNFKQYYASAPANEHAELILAHQTYGCREPKGDRENDKAVLYLMQRYAGHALYLVFDYDRDNATEQHSKLVEAFLAASFPGYKARSVRFASCRAYCRQGKLVLKEVLPRQNALRIGSEADFLTQGKACNQINALHFTNGHVVQAMDANMGVFYGEACKIPFALRALGPAASNRKAARARFLGFREHIYTMEDSVVGRCLASAEWTFGTIFQRFLSGMGARMHYGHPDFCDGFWVLNRGGMSKASPGINLSEDVFAGYNCKLRDEETPHVDYLEFLKGRETTLLAASGFYAKISGGSVAMLRSRDLQMLLDNTGIINAFTMYFATAGYYLSNLIVDCTIYLYVLLFMLLALATTSVADLGNLGTSLEMEWLVCVGALVMVPQLCETILEYGAGPALVNFVSQAFNNFCFFIFQNKTISGAMRDSISTGAATYVATGRPLANLHHTWRDNYIAYCYTHYVPALRLFFLMVMYRQYAQMEHGGAMVMIFTWMTVVVWLVAPVLFTPLPGMELLCQDIRGLMEFIAAPLPEDSGSGQHALATNRRTLKNLAKSALRARACLSHTDVTEESEAPQATEEDVQREEKATLRRPEEMRSLAEWGFTKVLREHRSRTGATKLFLCGLSTLQATALVLVVPANILDLLWLFGIVFLMRWCLVVLFFLRDHNNMVSFCSSAIWGALLLMPAMFGDIVGDRGYIGLPEYMVTFWVFSALLDAMRNWFLLLHCFGSRKTGQRQDQVVRYSYYFFCGIDADLLVSIIVLICHSVVGVFLVFLEKGVCFCSKRGAHTWWLLNRNIAESSFDAKKPAYQPKLSNKWRQSSFAPEPKIKAEDDLGAGWLVNP